MEVITETVGTTMRVPRTSSLWNLVLAAEARAKQCGAQSSLPCRPPTYKRTPTFGGVTFVLVRTRASGFVCCPCALD